jgi:hypothetical protein
MFSIKGKLHCRFRWGNKKQINILIYLTSKQIKKKQTKKDKNKTKTNNNPTNKQTKQKQNKTNQPTNQPNKLTIRRFSVFEDLQREMKPSFKYKCDYILA